MIQVNILGILNVRDEALLLEADDIQELIQKICDRVETIDSETLMDCAIIVNQKNIDGPDCLKVKLKDGDKVIFLKPISGG